MRGFACAVVLGLAVSGFATSAQSAVVVFEQGMATPQNGYWVSSTLDNFGVAPGFRVADNFSVGGTADITQVEWRAVIGAGAEDFTFTFYADASGKPGTELQSSGGTVSSTAVGGEILYSATLDSAFSATAGTAYWLSIFNQAADGVFRWIVVAGGDGSVQGQNPGPPWGASRPDTAFRLVGDPVAPVPEPSTLLLLGAGLAGLLWRAARTRSAGLQS